MGILDKLFGRSGTATQAAPEKAKAPASCCSTAPASPPRAKLGNASARDIKARMDAGEDFVLVDVREAAEREICKIDKAIHIPLSEIASRCNELPREKEIILHCHHGMRSQAAGHELLSAGFSRVTNMTGGIDAWALEVDSTIRRY